MNPNMAYYAIQTKIISKKGHIIRRLDWEKLLECKTVEQLKSLLLDNNQIRVLQDTLFADLNNLQTLYIHNNQLTLLTRNIFSRLVNLFALSYP